MLDILGPGSFPIPCIAVTRHDIGRENFGDISVVFGRGTIDPEVDSDNIVFAGDAVTQTFPDDLDFSGVDDKLQHVVSVMKNGEKIVQEDKRLLHSVKEMCKNSVWLNSGPRGGHEIYFEAKPQRAVGFDEVKAVIVPVGSSQALYDSLQDAGIDRVIGI